MDKKYDIFIVYRNKDLVIAHEILNWLGSDKDIAVGIYQTDKTFQKEQVDNILENSNNVVVLLSHDCFSIGKHDYKWFTYSIQRAVILNKAILPVNVDGSFSVEEKKKLSEEHIYVEQLLKSSELTLDTHSDIYTGFDRIGLWHSVQKQSQEPVYQVFVDISFSKTQAEEIFLQQLRNMGVVFDEPVDAKETGIEIGELIKGKSMYLYVMDSNNLRNSNISIAKANKIPYRYILLEENQTLINELPKEEMRFLCRHYDNRDKNELFATLASHGCVKQNNNIKANQSNMSIKSEYDIYISYRRSSYDISKKTAASLQERGYNVFFDTESIGAGKSFEIQITQAIKNCKTFIIIISKDSFDNTLTWQNKELQIAFEEKMVRKDFRILPIVLDANIEDIDYEKWPMLLRSIDCMTLNSGNLDEGIIQISNVLNQVDVPSHKPCEIFLAYPRIDKNTAIKVSTILENNGFSVWQDLDGINICDEFAHVIMTAIDEAKVFLLIESKWSRNSEWVKRELEHAVSKKKHIVKILTDNPEGLAGERRLNFSPSILEVGTKLFEEKLLAIILSKGCISDTSVISKEGERLYNELKRSDVYPIEAVQKRNLGYKSFSLFLRAVELGDEDAVTYIDSEPWDINLIECTNQYKEIYSNFINDLRERIYNKGIIIAEDETLTDISQRGRSMECVAFKFMKRAINLGYDGKLPENYDWCFLVEKDFETCNNTLGISSTYKKKNDGKSEYVSHKTEARLKMPTLGNSSVDSTNSYIAFLSHSSEDKEIIQKIYDILKQTEFRPWMAPQDIVPGKPYAKSIIEGINRCPVFLIFISASAMISDNVLSEIEKAHKEKKVILPIFIEDVPLNDELEYYLARKQWIKAFGKIEDFYTIIINSIKENLK